VNKIYIEISKLTDKFKTMCYGITQNDHDIENAVQELMIYFLSMNPTTLKGIWEKDGKEGIIRYGAVALRRSLTSPRSNFYYKYKRYYKTIHSKNEKYTYTFNELENKPENLDVTQWEKLEQIDVALDNLHWYDRELFKLYYYEGNTLDSLAAKTNISRNSLFTTIDKVREILKKELVDE
jgi:DNA-directed RNA polymerase specialized sigma24 family protein